VGNIIEEEDETN
jgi:hypothetical protein